MHRRWRKVMALWIKLFVATLALGWLALFFSSSAVLVWSRTIEAENPGGQASLSCRYFTGLGFVERSYWHSSGGILGRDACPRLVKL